MSSFGQAKYSLLGCPEGGVAELSGGFLLFSDFEGRGEDVF